MFGSPFSILHLYIPVMVRTHPIHPCLTKQGKIVQVQLACKMYCICPNIPTKQPAKGAIFLSHHFVTLNSIQLTGIYDKDRIKLGWCGQLDQCSVACVTSCWCTPGSVPFFNALHQTWHNWNQIKRAVCKLP